VLVNFENKRIRSERFAPTFDRPSVITCNDNNVHVFAPADEDKETFYFSRLFLFTTTRYFHTRERSGRLSLVSHFGSSREREISSHTHTHTRYLIIRIDVHACLCVCVYKRTTYGRHTHTHTYKYIRVNILRTIAAAASVRYHVTRSSSHGDLCRRMWVSRV